MAGPFERLHLIWIALPLAACQTAPPSEPAASAASDAAARGQAIAQSTCGACHAVGRFGSSNNPNAPPFPAIANQEELTRQTLSTWLSGAHNYPSEMDFLLHEPEVNALVAYMLTLRDPNYRRPPD